MERIILGFGKPDIPENYDFVLATYSPCDLLRHVCNQPKIFRQMCGFVEYKPQLNFYGIANGMNESLISLRQFQALRNHRDSILSCIKEHPIGYEDQLLRILIDLNGVECLADLTDYLAGHPVKIDPESKKSTRTVPALTLNDHIASAILAILHQEDWKGLIESRFEKEFRDRLLANEWFKKFDSREATLNDKHASGSFYYDERYGIAVLGSPLTAIDYDANVEAEVIQMARAFLASVPQSEWKGARGMTEWPVRR